MADEDSFGDDSFGDTGRGGAGDDDFDDSFEGAFGGGPGDENPMTQSQMVSNQPYDEAVAVSDGEDSINSPGAAAPEAPAPAPASPLGGDSFESDDPDQSVDQGDTSADTSAVYPSAAAAAATAGGGLDALDGMGGAGPGGGMDALDGMGGGVGAAGGGMDAMGAAGGGMDALGPGGEAAAHAAAAGAAGGANDDDTSSSDEESGMGTGTALTAGYDPSEYDALEVGNDVKDLFQHIDRYKPHQIELDTHLKPFIPEFIPAVGDIDAFVKVPRPDNAVLDAQNQLGLGILDEPAVIQSDATVLDLQLRQKTKAANLKEASIRSVESADKSPQVLTQWVESINDLHRSQPPPTVTYSNSMPSLDALMQAWPGEIEELLSKVEMPKATLDMDLVQFVTTLCAVLDIPVHEGKLTQSLHLLFELFSEFKKNQHFGAFGADEPGMLGMDGGMEGAMGEMGDMDAVAGTDTTFSGAEAGLVA